MPLWNSIVGALSAGAGGLINSANQSKQNALSMQFSREMYDRQKADNLAFWNTQNEYNSPQAQMKRFQAAGLNPNMIYGQGNPGNAAPIPTPDVQSPQFRSPEYGNAVSAGGLSLISSMYDLDIKQAQLDNLKADNTTKAQDAVLRAAQVESTQAGTDRTRFDLGLDTELRSVSADARREALRQLRTNIDLSTRRDIRESVQASSSLREAMSRIESAYVQRQSMRIQQTKDAAEISRIKADTARIRQSIRLMSQEGIIKDLDVKLSRDNIRPGDPLWYRAITQGINSMWDFFTK